MKKSDILISVLVIILLLIIVGIPVYLAEENSKSIELTIENYENLQLVQKSDFQFFFAIRNRDTQPAVITYEFLKDNKLEDSETLKLSPGEKRTFSYEIKLADKRKAHSYYINIPSKSQSIGFWTLPNSTYLRELESGPYIDRILPWELVDPLTQEYYRRG